jgi:hypothetical protein
LSLYDRAIAPTHMSASQRSCAERRAELVNSNDRVPFVPVSLIDRLDEN